MHCTSYTLPATSLGDKTFQERNCKKIRTYHGNKNLDFESGFNADVLKNTFININTK